MNESPPEIIILAGFFIDGLNRGPGPINLVTE